jgi:hypothetical protein
MKEGRCIAAAYRTRGKAAAQGRCIGPLHNSGKQNG